MMKDIPVTYDRNVLVGFDRSDDAGVYRISEDQALVQTLDFFTPIVDDPFTFGQIAAVNALSDVYAMGGTPITAMNIVAFPVKIFSLDILSSILAGGLDILKKAGVQLLGGHSVEDNELKYGLSVTGIINPRKILKNQGLRDGDAIILTKPLGTGIIGTVIKAGMASEELIKASVESMTALNRDASEVAGDFSVHACTDVTGFGLAGHLGEMIGSENMEVTIESAALPLLPGVQENSEMGLVPAGMYRNRDHVSHLCTISSGVPQHLSDSIFDPQTSGGLLIAVPEEQALPLVEALHERGVSHASVIAHAGSSSQPRIVLK